MTIKKVNKEHFLTDKDIREIVEHAFKYTDIYHQRLLFIIPDATRSAPVDRMFQAIYEMAAPTADKVDFLVALGTHPPMSQDAINARIGISEEERTGKYKKARFFNHNWKDRNQLKNIGSISASEVHELTGGRLNRPVDITINKMVFDYDQVFIVGPVFPHEVVGFSGGNKYLFPGISGQQIIDMFHWLGALITSPRIIGNDYTPVRAVVDKAASMLNVDKFAFTMVVKGKDDLAGLFFGNPESAWKEAAKLSDKLHIVYKDKPYQKVLSQAPLMYDDLWVGAKCMYKLEPVVADGGELIIYAPHIREISVSHGDLIRKIGYHSLPYFTEQMDEFSDVPGGVLAHSTHVKGLGSYENGIEKNRIKVTLATGIPEDTCREINLGYLDPNEINLNDWENRENEGSLYVPKAGEMLYRLKDDPFRMK